VSRPLLLAVALAAAWPAAARGYRPFDGTDAAVAERGALELEVGPLEYTREGAGARALIAPALTIGWGVAERWELVLEGRHLVPLDGAAIRPFVEDAALSAKRVLRAGSLQGGRGPSLATELAALLPPVDGPGRVGGAWAVMGSQRWPALTLHLNAAAAWTRAGAPAGSGSLIAEGPEAWPVRPVAEAAVERERGEPATVTGLAGAIWRASEALSFDAAVRVGRAAGVATTEVRLGFTWSVGVGVPR
jgi:hypothetical protein